MSSGRTRALLCGVILLFAGALTARGVGWCIEAADPSPYRHVIPLHDLVGEKLRRFDAHRDEYSVLFIGNSSTFRDIVPAVFDAELRARGFAIRSFNLGAPLVALPEALVQIREILERHPARLTWIVIDEGCPAFWSESEDLESVRHDYWHPPEALAATTLAAARADMPLTARARTMLLAWRATLRNLLKIGRAADAIVRQLAPDEDLPAQAGEDGYAPIVDGSRRDMFLARRDEYRRQVDWLHAPPVRASKYVEELMAKIDALCRVHGVHVALFAAPRVPRPPRVLGDGAPPAFRFDNPIEDADLLDPVVHADFRHLDDVGARLLSRRFAERFAALLAAKR